MIKKRSLVLSLPLLTGWRHERVLLSNDNRWRHHKRPITWFVGKHVPLWFKAASFENVTWTLPFYSWAAHSSGLWPGLHRGLGPTHSLHRPHHNHLYTVTWWTVALLDINHLNSWGCILLLSRWPNGLASQRKFLTCVQLAFRLATHLRWLWLSLTLSLLKVIKVNVLPSNSTRRYDVHKGEHGILYFSQTIADVAISSHNITHTFPTWMVRRTCILILGVKGLNSYASRRKFFTVWPPNTSQHNMIASQLYMREIDAFLRFAWTCEPTYKSVWPPFASPYASSGFVNLHWLALTCESVWPAALCWNFRKIATLHKDTLHL